MTSRCVLSYAFYLDVGTVCIDVSSIIWPFKVQSKQASATQRTNVQREKMTVRGMPCVSTYQMRTTFRRTNANVNLVIKETERTAKVKLSHFSPIH